MLPELKDLVEQYPLDWFSDLHPLCRYGCDSQAEYPGTLQIAEELGLKHPWMRDGSGPWRMTTDFVAILNGGPSLLAVARKPDPLATLSTRDRREKELLRIEREYWKRRDVEWLLITSDEFDARVVKELRRSAPWALADSVQSDEKAKAVRIAKANRHASLSQILQATAQALGSMEAAQASLWQSIWRGELPIDLRRSWRPYLPLRHISEAEFWSLNPVRSRRSAWPKVDPQEV
ncbi:TnsA endonuclease N-terminal domain-containing protein [Variovorax sp. YR216]|uniref:TnsA endonuclease N-terminal domain-containing protein n=1 Tax=Variovorax sp. YR216 TaxID=1882828 RepID=UPI00210950FF|nr:TnsA endonuclease N-terminal domain-containing protein [Variovorax sp. YR216]